MAKAIDITFEEVEEPKSDVDLLKETYGGESPLSVEEKLHKVQIRLKAPKGQYNSHGGYNYRSCEDILEALKPLLDEYGLNLVFKDEIHQQGDRFYVKATVTLTDLATRRTISTWAFAREDYMQKGMTMAQLTGSSSSFARKYALNAMFLIDDSRDPDMEPQPKQPQMDRKAPQRDAKPQQKPAKAKPAQKQPTDVEKARKNAWDTALRHFKGDKRKRIEYWSSVKERKDFEESVKFWDDITAELSRAW